MNTLYLSYDGMTDPLGQSQVLPYLIGLSKEGFAFTLISFEKEERFKKDGDFIAELCKKNNIDWKPINYTKRPPVLSTAFDLFQMYRMAKRAHRIKKFQLVHCRSYLSALIGLRLKKRFGIKMLFDMRGFWADERIEGNIWSKTNPVFQFIYSYFKKKEKQFFSESDAIISLTHRGKETILSWNLPHVTEQKITVIPCCVDLDLFDPTQISEEKKLKKRKLLGIENRFVIGYVGAIGTWYMLDEMLLVFKQIKVQQPHAAFLFVTRESPETIWEKGLQIGVQKEDLFVFSALHQEVPLYISLFDCSIFFIRPSFSKTASSPTKQGEIMAMGIPLICNTGVGDTDIVVQEFAAGQLVQDTSSISLEHFQLDLSLFNRENTIKGAQQFYSLKKGVASYLTVYQNTLLSLNESI